MHRILIYYPFQLAEKADSGSKLRPHEMIRAFQRWGQLENAKIHVISGESKERDEQFKKLANSGELEDLLFCYVENQTIPIWLTDKGHIPKRPFIDQRVFQFLKKRKVPIGIFYRDVYWKFDEIYPLHGFKKTIMKSIYRREERFFEKYADVIFLPSEEMGRFVDIDLPKVALPPGGKDLSKPLQKAKTNDYQSIYVGAIQHPDYGLPLLLDTIEQVRNQGISLSLTVVCRENEYQSFDQKKKDRMQKLGVKVKHLSGKDLDQLYQQMDFAFLPRYRSQYNDFSVPVKLVEYLSNRIPVIATDCTAQQRFVESGPYGVICQTEVQSMVESVRVMIDQHASFLEQIEKDFLKNHSWLARVWTVKKSLVNQTEM